MTPKINSSTPLNRFTGIDDDSLSIVEPRLAQFPIHCPLVPFYAKKGTTKTVYLNAAEKQLMYGQDTFDEESIFYDENTKLTNILATNGNIHATKRIKPSDAGEPANAVLYVDILAVNDLENWTRNSDGGYATDAELGTKIQVVDGTELTTDDGGVVTHNSVVDGNRIKYFIKSFPEGVTPGAQKILAGTMTSGGETSKMYPIMDIPAKYFGEAYSNMGIKISSVLGDALKDKFKSITKALPYEISIYERPDAESTGVVKKTMTGSSSTTLSFKKGAKNPYTSARLDADLVFPHKWYNEDVNAGNIRYYDLDNIHVYYDNLDVILNAIVATEVNHIDTMGITWANNVVASTVDWFDFMSDDDLTDEAHLLNWITLQSSKGVPYFTATKDTSIVTPPEGMEEVTLGDDSIIYLRNGSDGTISHAETEKFVKAMMVDYLDADSTLMNLVTNKESGMYDIGYSLETKKAMANMISSRPDTIVKWCTHDRSYGDTAMSLDAEYAIGVALLARARLFPESETFTTTACRALVTIGSMESVTSLEKYRYTQNLEIANIFSKYLGASNGKAIGLKALDSNRTNTVLKLGKNYTPIDIPFSFKETLWTSGINYSEPYNFNQKAFLALRTIYSEESSILTSPVILYANAVMCRAMDEGHKKYAGNEKWSRAVYATKMISFLNKQVLGTFDANRYVMTFDVIYTNEDIKNGYSYQIVGNLGGNVMKTAQLTTVRTYRKEA